MDSQFFHSVWSWLLAHTWALALALAAAAFVAAWLVDLIFTRVLKGLAMHTKTILDDQIIARLHRPIWASILAGAAMIALEVFMHEHPWKGTLVNLMLTILVVIWALALIQISRVIFRSLRERHRGDPTLGQLWPLLDNLILVLLIVAGGYWVFKIWQINVTPLLASAGIVTAAVALASKDTLANLLGGVSVFLDKPYRLGDYIISGGGERGQVVDIGIRSTRILTRDDVLISIPNSEMANTKIINESGQVPRFRVRVSVGVGFESDLDLVEEVLLQACEEISEILPSPKPRVRFREIGESTLNYQLLAWVHNPGDRGRIVHLLNTKIVKLCRQAGIDLAFPQRVISFRPGQESQVRVWLEREQEKRDRKDGGG